MDGGRGPGWLAPPDGPTWPTRRRALPEVGLTLDLPAHWDTPPETLVTPPVRGLGFRGPRTAECLIVHLVSPADPATDIGAWVEAPIRLSGFPLPEVVGPEGSPELLEWRALPAPADATARLSADECRCYEGVAAVLEDGGRSLRRLYVLLARRGTRAWKVALVFASACPPGFPPDLVAANDHVRAAATFGTLTID
jgi:hypothetical protein